MQETVLLYNIDKTDAGKAIISILEKKHTLECGFQAICYLFVTYLVHFILFLQAKNYSPNTSLSCNKISGV